MPRRRRESTDPASHHGFLDSVDEDEKAKRKRRRETQEDQDGLDLDHLF